MIQSLTPVRFIRVWNDIVTTESSAAYTAENGQIVVAAMPPTPNIRDGKITDQYVVIDNVTYDIRVDGENIRVLRRRPTPAKTQEQEKKP